MTDSSATDTLDPPGTIAVVGAGPLGIEAALYGRFLGYDVTVFEAESVGCHLLDHQDDPLPMLPDRCLSPLAISALNAQSEGAGSQILPVTVGQWLEQALLPLTQSDLLTGRLAIPKRVVKIESIEIQPDEDDDDRDEVLAIPADFRLTLSDGATSDAEAVVLAIGTSPAIAVDFAIPSPYFFQIGQDRDGDAERQLHNGLREIVQIFAQLVGRVDLDLYRPLRH